MDINEFKDRLFDAVNESDSLPVTDITANDRQNEFKVFLKDHSSFIIKCYRSGTWFLIKM